MCGRYSLFTPRPELEARFDATFDREFEPRYNAAPRQSLPVITDEDSDTVRHLQWGLVPSWADDERDASHINARAETLAEKPSFRDAFHRRETTDGLAAGRCLVLADGFYEWTDRNGRNQPHRITLAGERPFAMAGLYAQWRPPQKQTGLGDFAGGGAPDADPDVLETFTIVTTDANAVVGDLHDRMSVILPEDVERRWLTDDAAAAADLLTPYPVEKTRSYPVSTDVNDPRNDAPHVVEPVDG
jgi:putative SOS response-associated peptidase YedK